MLHIKRQQIVLLFYFDPVTLMVKIYCNYYSHQYTTLLLSRSVRTIVNYEKLLVQILIKYLVSKVSTLQSYVRFPEQNKKYYLETIAFSAKKKDGAM